MKVEAKKHFFLAAMCGIFGCISKHNLTVATYDMLDEQSARLVPRGPDDTKVHFNRNVYLSFHRLVINDLSIMGNQPMFSSDGDKHMICNGEIFNHVDLETRAQIKTNSTSDCEVVLRLYEKYRNLGMQALQAGAKVANELDGEFAAIIHDQSEDCLVVFRDPFGVRPLFMGFDENDRAYFASEAKALSELCPFVEQFPPGHIAIAAKGTLRGMTRFCADLRSLSSFSLSVPKSFYLNAVRELFLDAVKKRMMSERPMCALLSGGLDSSLVASILAREMNRQGLGILKTFSIGLSESPDLEYAAKVAAHIGSHHHAIMCSHDDFIVAIPEVIKTIESYDVTTVRASVGNFLVSKYIANTTDCKVVFTGDYADEVMSGYKYFAKAPDMQAFHEETVRLLSNIHYFDSLRSDRTISCHGLEARVPYADRTFVDFFLRIPVEFRMTAMEKLLIRQAFQHDNLLPEDVLFRRKEAFSDGVSSASNSWHNIIKSHVDKLVSDFEFKNNKSVFGHNPPQTKEAYYYRKIFSTAFGTHSNLIPYSWMPMWCDGITDPSAREIQIDMVSRL